MGKSKNSSHVFQEFFLDYHLSKTLKNTLKENFVCFGLRKWPIQIVCRLEQLYHQNITYINLKLLNIVININNNIIITDISGIAFINKQLAPEMYEIDDFISLLQKTHYHNNIQTYEKLLSMITQLESDKKQARLLNDIIEEIKNIEPSKQVELYYIIAKLKSNPTLKPIFLLALYATRQNIYLF